ncbi:sulfite exporter TauE/SafE family protein [Acidianus brierleyi]|uniref:Probable membrane transporter protein n=1 Tax=Acidianus brierleyi TaxID=41673 RepID=A0A2U9IF90_9CREN|nr:sulfite exporter TauE/SafE family protein [Acidianus brierleyi]AWR94614.1 TSUP family transporter [Acidianus brierleyi]
MVVIDLTPLQYLLSIVSGILVGFSLGLIGGGGSILAIPLLLYFVGLYYAVPIADRGYAVHLAIGTTALAVGLNAYINSYIHFKKGNVKVPQGIMFTLPGLVGVFAGTTLDKITPGNSLLFFFSILMIVVALMMLRPQKKIVSQSNVDASKGFSLSSLISSVSIKKVIPAGFLVGFASGYFGIGGGFLVVPGLLFSTGLCMVRAVGTSLIAVGTFGVASAISYTFSGYVLFIVSILYLLGGIAGGYAGASIASRMPRGLLRKIFAIIIIIVAIYTMYTSINGLYLLLHILGI